MGDIATGVILLDPFIRNYIRKEIKNEQLPPLGKTNKQVICHFSLLTMIKLVIPHVEVHAA